jgi:hypothetical protein
MKLVLAAAAAAAGLGATASAMAQDAPTYPSVYGDLGWADTNAQGSNTGSITGRVGGRFMPYAGVEVEGALGVMSGGKDIAPIPPAVTGAHVDVKQRYAGAAYAVGFLPIMPNADLLARIGYGGSSYDIGPAGLSSYHASETGIRYGVGAQFFADGANGVRADYTRVHFNSLNDPGGYFSSAKDASVWSLAYTRKF